MRKTSLFAVIVVLFTWIYAHNVLADEEIAPRSYVSSSHYGTCYFRMKPSPEGKWFSRDKGSGQAFQVTQSGKDNLLWSTNGWYAERVFLSDDCVHLVRLGNWPRGHEPSEKDLAVAFYKAGQLIKSYSTKELIKDRTKVTPSVSHYQFLRAPARLSDTQLNKLSLVTVDGLEYVFDIEDGSIIRTGAAPAKN